MRNAESIQELGNYEGDIIRFSVANLISDCRGWVLWIINKKWLKYWQKKISAIWWAALLKDKTFLENLWAICFEWDDCRFRIGKDKLNEVTKIFADNQSWIFEADPMREVREELEEEILPWFMDKPILSVWDTTKLVATFVDAWIETGYWVSEKRDIPTIYIWRYFHLWWDSKVLKKMLKHKIIYELSQKDCMQRKASDGTKLWPNVIAASKLVY